jgi:hypothetical protein
MVIPLGITCSWTRNPIGLKVGKIKMGEISAGRKHFQEHELKTLFTANAIFKKIKFEKLK